MHQTYEELKHRVAELEKFNRIFESMVSQSPAAIVITNEKGGIEYCNDAFYQVFGYHPGEVKDEHVHAILRGNGPATDYGDLTKKVLSGKTWRGELKQKHKDGQDFWSSVVIYPVVNIDTISHYVIILNDITEEKLIKERNREQENLHKLLVENLPLIISIYDLNGTFIFANENTDKFFRMEPGALTGKNFREIFPPEVAAEQFKNLQQILKTRKSLTIDRELMMHGHMNYFKARHNPMFDENGEIKSILVIGENITSQVQHEKLLNIQNQIDSLSNLTANLTSSLKKAFQYLLEIEWIDAGGIYLFDEDRKNLRLVFSIGLSGNYLKQVSVFSSSDPPAKIVLEGKARYAQTRTFLEPLKNVMVRENLLLAVSIPLIYKKEVIGSLNLGSKTVEAISPDDRLVIESIASRLANLIVLVRTKEELVTTNIRLNRSINEIEKQQQMLIQKSRLESLGELSAGLAHEINQPISVISLVMENVVFKHEQNAATKEYLSSKFAIISQNINKVRQLIDHVRIFSRDHGNIVFERIEINNVIINALSMIHSLLTDKQIRVNIKLSPKVLYTIGNPSRFEQIILNLLSNSKDALGEKERKSSARAFSKEINISTSVEKDKAIIIVRDNGTGIPRANLEKLFIPFFTTKTDGMGTGLGLPIVYGILREMEGDISVSSEEGEFTEMKIILPHHKKIVDKK